jgi:hypothetical protein
MAIFDQNYATLAEIKWLFNFGTIQYLFFKIFFKIKNNSFCRCAAKSGQINSAIILFSTITIVLTLILFCYISILKKIYNTPDFLTSSSLNSRSSNTTNDGRINALEYYSEVERRAAKKILSYIAMFILQWIPMSVSQGARFVLVRYFIEIKAL